MFDRTESAQFPEIVDIDMPVVDLVTALPQEVADHVLARSFRAAGTGNRDKIPRGSKLRVEIGVDGIEDFALAIYGVQCVPFPSVRDVAKAAPPRSNHTLPDFADVLGRFQNRRRADTLRSEISRPIETPDARQPQYYVPHHRRADRRGGRARLQSLPDQEATGGPADQCRSERAEDPKQVKQAAPLMMMASHIKRFSLPLLGGFGLFALATSAMADQVSREQDIVGLRLGPRIQVDDGSCPAGQIKEVSGTRLTPSGIVAARKCVPRLGPRKR